MTSIELTDGWTIGTELEIANSRRDTPLPAGATWDKKDYTIVNSNGVANDPRGKTWKFGGEINTAPSTSIAAQRRHINEILMNLSPAPVTNYRSNLHIHVRIPGLREDVQLAQRLIYYSIDHSQAVFDFVDPLPKRPTMVMAEDPAGLSYARWKRRSRSHHTILTPRQRDRVRAATTPEELRAAHAPMSQDGIPQYHLVQRPGINFRSVWEETETIEFRHWCLSMNTVSIAYAMEWCVYFLQCAIESQLLDFSQWNAELFPSQPLINIWQEKRYRKTSPRYHTYAHIIATLERWERDGELWLTQ